MDGACVTFTVVARFSVSRHPDGGVNFAFRHLEAFFEAFIKRLESSGRRRHRGILSGNLNVIPARSQSHTQLLRRIVDDSVRFF